MFVTLDTHVLIWAVKNHCTPGQEPMLEKARKLLKYLHEQKEDVVLTAITVSEYLVGADDTTAATELQLLQQDFPILPFNTKAAKIAARLFRDREQTLGRAVQPGERTIILADTKIVATALSHNVGRIYSNDDLLRKFAKAGSLVCDDVPDELPKTTSQKSLFDE